MPDISMCDSTTCPAKFSCYRNPASGTKPDSDYQSWLSIDQDDQLDGRCRYYMLVSPQELAANFASELADLQ